MLKIVSFNSEREESRFGRVASRATDFHQSGLRLEGLILIDTLGAPFKERFILIDLL